MICWDNQCYQLYFWMIFNLVGTFMEFLLTIFHFFASLSLFTVCHIYTNSDFKFSVCLFVCCVYVHRHANTCGPSSLFSKHFISIIFLFNLLAFWQSLCLQTPLPYIIYQYVWLTCEQYKAHYIIELMFVSSSFAWHKMNILYFYIFYRFFPFLQICMAILRTYSSIKESGLLKRAGMVQ